MKIQRDEELSLMIVELETRLEEAVLSGVSCNVMSCDVSFSFVMIQASST